MTTFIPDRNFAFTILKEYIKNESLIRHALTMEAVIRYFAGLFYKEEVDKWGIIGLLHDIDYERYADKHCLMVREILSPHGFPEEYLRAIESHGYKIVTDVEPVETMEKALYAADELTGLIAATVLLRPGKSIMDLKVSSVKKKWKQKGFASGVNRNVIEEGAKMLGMELDLLIEHTIKGMQTVAEEIGLKGEL
ncbi:MAG: HD domain-containing protein [Actinobacteria bacterium]|nr:HD domain-containing protein [Actinomycetota bacterium]MBM3712141.1 HD domain-containing protein [Actinomycetota bacterium]